MMARACAVAVTLMLTMSAGAVDIHVPQDCATIQDAVAEVAPGDVIILSPGTYTGPGNFNVHIDHLPITIRSADPNDPDIVASTIINCRYAGNALQITEDVDYRAVIAGLTIANGRADDANSGSWGGAIACTGDVSISNCRFLGNYAADHGGALALNDCSGTVSDCEFSGNTASSGGAISVAPRWLLEIQRCRISDNYASELGGGVSVLYNSPPSGGGGGGGGRTAVLGAYRSGVIVRDSEISLNVAGKGGGFSAAQWSMLELTRCSLKANHAETGGGGFSQAEDLYVHDSVMIGNTALQAGAVDLDSGDYALLENCTITANFASLTGAIAQYSVACYLSNCIVWANSDSSGDVLAAQLYKSSSYDPLSVAGSCVQDENPDDAYIVSDKGTPTSGSTTNIDDDPCFVRPPDDGGDGWGVGDNDDFGDLRLRVNSPCIDAGQPRIGGDAGNLDFAGSSRFVGTGPDIGAWEYGRALLATAPSEGQLLAAGSTHIARWSSWGVEDAVDIMFTAANAPARTLAAGVANTGSHPVVLPADVDSNDCRITVAPSNPDPNVLVYASGVFAVAPDSQGPPQDSPWPTLGGSPARLGLSSAVGPDQGCVRWRFETDGGVVSSITVGAGDRIHIASGSGTLYTLEPDGTVAWTYHADAPLLSSPTVGLDGSVFVGDANGILHAIDPQGKLRWTYPTGAGVYCSPAVSADSKVFVGSLNGCLYALGPDGSELWSFRTKGAVGQQGGAIFASPALASDGTVYVAGLYDPNLYALDPNDGHILWRCTFESEGQPFASPVVSPGGTIYQTLLYDPNLYAIDPNGGQIIWARNLALDYSTPPESSVVSCMSWPPFAGTVPLARGSESLTEPVIGPDGTIYAGLDDVYLRAINPDGTLKWVRPFGRQGLFTLAVGADGLVYAGSDDGMLYVLDSQGAVVAFIEGEGGLSHPVLVGDDMLLFNDAKENSVVFEDYSDTIWAVGAPVVDGAWPCLRLPEDLNADGRVDFADLTLMTASWLQRFYTIGYPSWDPNFVMSGDVDGDFQVDYRDLMAMADRWLGSPYSGKTNPVDRPFGWMGDMAASASHPDPNDGASFTAGGKVLTWRADGMCYLYFGTVNPPPFQAAVEARNGLGSYSVSTHPESTYYWRVDTIANGTIVHGPTWSFTVTLR